MKNLPFATLIDSHFCDETGVIEEVWCASICDVAMRFTPNGTSSVHADGGDWEGEFHVRCATIDQLRQQAQDYLISIPVEA